MTVIVKHLEMGQGTYTGLPTLVAEELDARWDQVRAEGAPADAKLYNNLFWGPAQGTGGSTAMANSFDQLRKAGAAARQMLRRRGGGALAGPGRRDPGARWGPEPRHGPARDLRRAGGGRGAATGAAGGQPQGPGRLQADRQPRHPPHGQRRQDRRQRPLHPGRAPAWHAHRPGRPPVALRGSGPAPSIAAPAKGVSGVEQVVRIPSGLAVLGRDFWSAKLGRDALAPTVVWDEADAFRLGSEEILAQYRELAGKTGCHRAPGWRCGGGPGRRRPGGRRRSSASPTWPMPPWSPSTA